MGVHSNFERQWNWKTGQGMWASALVGVEAGRARVAKGGADRHARPGLRSPGRLLPDMKPSQWSHIGAPSSTQQQNAARTRSEPTTGHIASLI